jgi:hypothetical protein
MEMKGGSGTWGFEKEMMGRGHREDRALMLKDGFVREQVWLLRC